MIAKQNKGDLAEKIRAGRTSKKRKGIYIILLLLLLGGGVFALRKYQAAGDKVGPGYVTEKLERGEVSLTVTATGNLEPTNEVSVGSEISGTMDKVLADYNDTVEEGQVVATLDTTKLEQQTDSLRASVLVAKASVNQAAATLAESESSLSRLQQLHKISNGKTPSQADLDTAVASRDRAVADLESAEAVVKKATAEVKVFESDLDKSEIKSPINGIVLSRTVEPGQTVAAQFSAPELFIVAETLTRMKLEVAVAEADIGRMEEGQSASFTVDAWPDRTYEATVRKVSFASVITDNVVTYEAELEVENDDLSLRPGMTATADIQVAESENVLLVSNAALRFNPESAVAEEKSETKQSFLESLSSRPPRGGSKNSGAGAAAGGNGGGQAAGGGGRGEGGGPPGGKGGKGGPGAGEGGGKKDGGSAPKSIWIMEGGEPKMIRVRTGLTDGRYTEVMGPEVEEGMEVIIRKTVKKS